MEKLTEPNIMSSSEQSSSSLMSEGQIFTKKFELTPEETSKGLLRGQDRREVRTPQSNNFSLGIGLLVSNFHTGEACGTALVCALID